MEELTPPLTIFDTYVPGLLSSQTATVVGALRTAAFEIVPEGDNSFRLQLRHYWPPAEDEPSARFQAEALQKYIIPRLIDPQDCVIEIIERQGLVFKRFMLLMMVRDRERKLRGVGALVVDCTHLHEARRRLLQLQRIVFE
jgi:hypothetical protein